MSERSYSDEALIAAVAASRSWRGVLRALGLKATSAGSARSVRTHADRLGLSYSHFTGQRRWTDVELTDAVRACNSWAQVATSLRLSANGGTNAALRAHAHRLALSVDHLGKTTPPTPPAPSDWRFEPRFLRDAGSHFAATWFALHGAKVSWPLEPCRYDLLVDCDGVISRIQVKTTEGTGPDALVIISNARRVGRALYEPGEVDAFFAIDAELSAYLIPYDVVAGYKHLSLGRYANFKVAERGGLLSVPASP